MSKTSKLLAFTRPIEYMRGVMDHRKGKHRDLDAYPADTTAQQAYEYGWADRNEGMEFSEVAEATMRYKLWKQSHL
jgi:hypothetical protein